jgi:hypothetical protein
VLVIDTVHPIRVIDDACRGGPGSVERLFGALVVNAGHEAGFRLPWPFFETTKP